MNETNLYIIRQSDSDDFEYEDAFFSTYESMQQALISYQWENEYGTLEQFDQSVIEILSEFRELKEYIERDDRVPGVYLELFKIDINDYVNVRLHHKKCKGIFDHTYDFFINRYNVINYCRLKCVEYSKFLNEFDYDEFMSWYCKRDAHNEFIFKVGEKKWQPYSI